jgi:hypothetical protein
MDRCTLRRVTRSRQEFRWRYRPIRPLIPIEGRLKSRPSRPPAMGVLGWIVVIVVVAVILFWIGIIH